MNKMDQKNLEGNIDKICLMNFLDGLWFPLPVYVIYLLDSHMSWTQIGMILGAAAVMPFFFDIPSSIWADKYSRRFVMILSSIAFLLANIFFYISNSFELFFLGSCLNGIGIAFSTGIFSAFIYDTLLSLGEEKQYERVQSKVMKYFFTGRLIASAIGAYVYLTNPKMVFLLSIFVSSVCLVLTFYLKEPSREKSISKSFRQAKEGLEFLLKNRNVWNLVVIFSIMCATCDVLFNYYQPVLQASGISVAYFGIVYVFVNAFSFLGASLYPKIKSKINWKYLMVFYLLVDFVSSLFFGTQIAALVLLSVVFMSLSFGSFEIFIGSIVHRAVPSSHRATTLSIRSQIYMLSYFIFINVVGFSIDHGSIFVGMFINALVALAVLLVFVKTVYIKTKISDQLLQKL